MTPQEKALRVARITQNVLGTFNGPGALDAMRVFARRRGRGYEPRLDEEQEDDLAELLWTNFRTCAPQISQRMLNRFPDVAPVKPTREPEPAPSPVETDPTPTSTPATATGLPAA